jgi:exonuclease III/ribonuclease HI
MGEKGNNNMHKLSIFQWNCRSIQNKLPILSNFLKEHFCHVLLLQSLSCSFFQLPKIAGFYYPPVCDSENGKIMTAIYVRCSITYTSFSMPTDTIDCRASLCCINIPCKGKKSTKIVNVYYPNGSSKSKQVEWIENLNTDESNWIVGGDFNVSNYLWDSEAPVGQGDHLADCILNSTVTELNDGTFTRLGNKNQRNTAIDITLASNDLSSDFSWRTADDSLFSDHLPIMINFNNQCPVAPDYDPNPKYKYKYANWDVFQALITAESKRCDPFNSDLNLYFDNIRNIIIQAADIAIPKFSSKPHNKHKNTAEWWTKSCDVAVSKKRKALRNYQKIQSEENKNILIESEKHCKEILDNAKSQHWEDFCLSEIQNPSDISLLWKKVNSLQRNYNQPVKPLDVNGCRTTNAYEKASVLAETFAKSSQSQHLTPDERNFRRDQEACFLDPVADNSTMYNADLTLSDLNLAINHIPSKEKATGSDPISNLMLRHLPETFKKVLLAFFQACWTSGSIPDSWREAVVVGIPKQGKPKHLPTSYRPIALTSHMCKLYERIVKSRLEYILEANEIIPICQAGFRKNRSCTEHVVHLIEHTKRATCNKQTTVATFFDINRAFDSVWHAKLLNKMSCLGISGHLFDFVKSFIEDRRISVQVGSAISPIHILDMGVPQGSVIAPILFSIMLHDLDKELGKPGLFITLYADDLAVWMDCNSLSSKGRHLWLKRFQSVINSIQNYMKNNGFKLCPEKTSLMVFTRKFKSRKDFYITINNCRINPSITTKFLGVVLHQNLSWEPHIQHLITKARKGVSLIKLLCGVTWVTQKSLIHLTQALVRSRLCYGHEATFTKSDTQWLALERIELRAIKAALGVSLYAINDLVYQNIGWLPLREHCKLLTAKFQVRVTATVNNVSSVLGNEYSSNDDTFRQRLSKSKPLIHRITTPLYSYTKDLIDSNLAFSTEATSSSDFPNWTLKQANFDYHYADHLAKDNSPILISSLAKENIDTHYSNNLQYYTDGSVLKSGEIGCAFVVPKLHVKRMFKLNPGISIFSAELYAIHKACCHINEMKTCHQNIVIFSDSKSVLQSLSKGGSNTRRFAQNAILKLIDNILGKVEDLTLMWIPSHSNIFGNELADRAAKTAATNGEVTDISFSKSELINHVKQNAISLREDQIKKRCKDHNWLFLPGHKNHIPNLPRYYQKVINRIRVQSPCYRFNHFHCPCGDRVSLDHCIKCSALPQMSSVRQLQIKYNLLIEDLLQLHPSLGDVPMRTLVTAIVQSDIRKWF